jgi:hypothetical protein
MVERPVIIAPAYPIRAAAAPAFAWPLSRNWARTPRPFLAASTKV